jgi:hypothetical protein
VNWLGWACQYSAAAVAVLKMLLRACSRWPGFAASDLASWLWLAQVSELVLSM